MPRNSFERRGINLLTWQDVFFFTNLATPPLGEAGRGLNLHASLDILNW